MSSDDKVKRCARCERWLPQAEFGLRRASPDGLQHWCRSCSSVWAASRRPPKRKIPPAVPEGHKWCRRCENIKPVEDFGVHRGLKDGRQTYCRECCSNMYRARREEAGHVVRPAVVPEGHKFCRQCATVKPLRDWSLNEHASDGLRTRCKACATEAGRRDHLRRNYGLDLDGVAVLLERQRGVCAICLLRPAVHVDHDHVTGEVRGMLCFRCNAALGQLDDDVGRLHRAADYLRGRRLVIRSPHAGVFVIGRTDPAPSSRA